MNWKFFNFNQLSNF